MIQLRCNLFTKAVPTLEHSFDLVSILGLPYHVDCPHCKKQQPTYFDEYDLDEPLDTVGTFQTQVYCASCHKRFTVKTQVIVTGTTEVLAA